MADEFVPLTATKSHISCHIGSPDISTQGQVSSSAKGSAPCGGICRNFNHGQSGYTLIELLMALLLTSLLVVSAFSALQTVQLWWQNLEQMISRDENLRTAPLLLVRWIAPAGTNRHNSTWTGVAANGSALELRADFDGSSGFPDGQLTESFERVTIRLKENELQIRSGNGSFQPFLKHISQFAVEAESPFRVILDLEAVTPTRLSGLQETQAANLVFRTSLPNYFDNLFPEQLP